MTRYAVLSLALSALCTACGHDCLTGPLGTADLTADQVRTLHALAPWTSDAKVCSVGGYIVIGPKKGKDGELLIVRDGKAVVDIDGPHVVNVLSDSQLVASVQSRGGQGRFDYLTYAATDSDRGFVFDVTDGDMDGRLDFKVVDDVGFVNIDGQWDRLEKRDGVLGAIIGNAWRPVAKHGARWQVVGE